MPLISAASDTRRRARGCESVQPLLSPFRRAKHGQWPSEVAPSCARRRAYRSRWLIVAWVIPKTWAKSQTQSSRRPNVDRMRIRVGSASALNCAASWSTISSDSWLGAHSWTASLWTSILWQQLLSCKLMGPDQQNDAKPTLIQFMDPEPPFFNVKRGFSMSITKNYVFPANLTSFRLIVALNINVG